MNLQAPTFLHADCRDADFQLTSLLELSRCVRSRAYRKHLTRCLGFISRALQSAKPAPETGDAGAPTKAVKVLVHCHAGESRSVAVVAAHLMKTEDLSLEEALESIRKVRPRADPNEGFREQLRLYCQMGCRIDVNHSAYRHHLLLHQGKKAVVFPTSTDKKATRQSSHNQGKACIAPIGAG